MCRYLLMYNIKTYTHVLMYNIKTQQAKAQHDTLNSNPNP